MVETGLSPIHILPSGLCEDSSGEARGLIRRMANRDPAALVELHGMWCPILLGAALRMLGDAQEADKAVQETFIQLWGRASNYDPHQSPPFVWAFAVLRAYCIQRLRRRSRSKKPPPPVSHIHFDKHENPRVMPLDDFRRVRSALDHLTPDERNCLELAVFLGCRTTESPDHPDTSVIGVKNRLRQALKKIRNHLSRYEL